MRRVAAGDADAPGFAAATAVLRRGHFKRVYERNPTDDAIVRAALEGGMLQPSAEQTDFSPASFLSEELRSVFGAEAIFYDRYVQTSNPNTFPVLMGDGRIESSIGLSDVLRNIPQSNLTNIYSAPQRAIDALDWIAKNRGRVFGEGGRT